VAPGRVLHFYNLPADCGPADLKFAVAERSMLVPEEVRIFPSRPDAGRSLSGLMIFESQSEAVDVVAKCNHAQVRNETAAAVKGGTPPSLSSELGRCHTLKLCFSVNDRAAP